LFDCSARDLGAGYPVRYVAEFLRQKSLAKMQLEDFDGHTAIDTEDVLLTRLRSVRRGVYGAFMLSHADLYPALSVQLNHDFAYLHYFPGEDHPGYQPRGMTPNGCTGDYRFLLTNNCEADSFDMPAYTLVSAQAAYAAAIDFFRAPVLPNSVTWFEL
jgi:hypothetical protein